MKIDELYAKLKPLFNELGIPMIEFEESTEDEFISKDYYSKDDMDYIIFVDKNGKISYGITDGVIFNECGVLGYI